MQRASWIFRGQGRRAVTIHGGQEIGPPLFFKILRQLGITQEDFQDLR
ncbi:MAG: hypothetical protein WCC92_11330 [Candidatus Korobacteraceae bacterium]